MTRLLNVLRHGLILGVTAYATWRLWDWHWIAAILACIPIYIVALNVVGFLTLPLYAFTPENRRARQMGRELEDRIKSGGV